MLHIDNSDLDTVTGIIAVFLKSICKCKKKIIFFYNNAVS
jgi:hypothetical protein